MTRGSKIILGTVFAAVTFLVVAIAIFVSSFFVRAKRHQVVKVRQQAEFAQFQNRNDVTRRIETQRRRSSSRNAPYVPISNLYRLRERGCEDHDLSGMILQNDLIKKDRNLMYRQQDIDELNEVVLDYVRRGVVGNDNYLLRRKLVETFGQTSSAELVNRMRLVAVLLGGEKGRGGMDPKFTPIREEVHRYSPYVLVLVRGYIEKLEKQIAGQPRQKEVPEEFKRFVHSLGKSNVSEWGLAETGKQKRNQPENELYAMKVLYRDVLQYYGERVEGGEAQNYEVVFSDPGDFQSETFQKLKRGHASMSPKELADGFMTLGMELRGYLSDLRDDETRSRWGNEEVRQLTKINEIVAALTGLVARERLSMPPLDQTRTLTDLLYLEGLYSTKELKGIKVELAALPEAGPQSEKEIRAFHRYLSYLHGLAYARMDEALGEAARAYTKFTPAAANYMEIQARKSALQILGQLQKEYYQKHGDLLAGEKDIHLAGQARGELRVFRTQSEIAAFLREDPSNGEGTIWVLKSGLNMPNEASFAAIILEDPIMKASHYDGYARSRTPPIPLLQVPKASEAYADLNGKYVLLEAAGKPDEKVALTETTPGSAVPSAPVGERLRLQAGDDRKKLYEIHGKMTDETVRALQKQVGAKAANYAFLRSTMPLGETRPEEHNYPGFAIPFVFYQEHVERNGIDGAIAKLATLEDSQEIKDALLGIQEAIMAGSVDRELMGLIRDQMENRFRGQHRIEETAVKMRFRSSSNAEDNKDFSGAGLYESHPAYYAYTKAPAAEYAEQEESQRDIPMAIKKVWASVWKAEAYLARERAGIVQETVRMGILVHPSYRKEDATGVVFYYGPDDIEIVANKDNENVQNPSVAGLTPEMHRITTGGNRESDRSSRYILSGKEVLSAENRAQLLGLIELVAPRFREVYPEQGIQGVDVEFKLMEVPDGTGEEVDVMMLKQIRPLADRVTP